MTLELDWRALRRPLLGCAIGSLPLLAFLVFWQVFIPESPTVPGASPSSGDFWIWPLILATSVCVPSGLGLPVAASRRLWRGERRGLAGLALALPLLVILLPAGVGALGAGRLSQFVSVFVALLLSGALSAYLIVSTRVAVAQPATALDPRVNFNADEPHAYARDVSAHGKLD